MAADRAIRTSFKNKEAKNKEAKNKEANREVLVHAVDRAVSILDALKSGPGEYGISELASTLNLYKGTVRQILVTLEYRGLVHRNDSTKRYQLGPAMVEYGEAVLRRMNWRLTIHPLMQELMTLTDLTVLVSILEGTTVMIVDQVVSTDPRRFNVSIGQRLSLVASPAKVLLAHADGDALDAILAKSGLPRHTDKSIVDETVYRALLRHVRESGFAIDDEELIGNVRGVAAPIIDHRGKVIAALSIAGLKLRVTDERLPELIDHTIGVARRMSARLGAPGLR